MSSRQRHAIPATGPSPQPYAAPGAAAAAAAAPATAVAAAAAAKQQEEDRLWYWDDLWTDLCFAVEAMCIAPLVVLACTSCWFLAAALRFAWHGCRAPRCRPRVTAQPCNAALVDACPTLRRRLEMPWWAWSGAAVNMVFSIVGRFGLASSHVSYTRFVLRRGGGQPPVEVDVWEAQRTPSATAGGAGDAPVEDAGVHFVSAREHPVIVFSPGFGSNSFSRYAETFVRQAHALGYTIVVSNARGAAVHPKSQLDTPSTYTFGDWADYAHAVRWASQRYPRAARLFAVGYSMGGSTVMQAISRADPRLSEVVDAAVCCCQGYDVEMGAEEIIRRPLYNWLLCVKIRRLYRQQHLRRLLRYHPALPPGRIGACLRSCHTLRAWDTHWSAPTRGFGGNGGGSSGGGGTGPKAGGRDSGKGAGSGKREEDNANDRVWAFWRWCGRASACTEGVNIPTLCVNARDDPMVPERLHGLGAQLARDNPHVVHVLTDFGSHLGFYKPGARGGVSAPPNVTWLEDMVFEFLAANSNARVPSAAAAAARGT